MGRPSLILLILLAIVGSWMFFNEVPLDRLTSSSRGREVVSVHGRPGHPLGDAHVRIATFNLDGFDIVKSNEPGLVSVVAHVMSRFDVIAVQEIESAEHHLLPKVVDELNRLKLGSYDFVVGPRVGRETARQQFGFVYNHETIEIDRYATYSVNDPDDLIRCEPLVACFRATRVHAEEAFTFSLVNIDTYEGEVERETALLSTVFASVRNDGRLEDDIIVLGDFQLNAAQLQRDVGLPGMTFIVGETNSMGAHYDNIMIDTSATTEFTGRSGVFDLVRQLNVDTGLASRISRHFPVWAEFSCSEGGAPGHVAMHPSIQSAR